MQERPRSVLLVGYADAKGLFRSNLLLSRRRAAAVSQALLQVLGKEQAGLTPETPQQVAYGTGLYSADISRQTYATLALLARTALQQGRSVLIDAACSKQTQRQGFEAVAHETGAECYVLECYASEAVIRQRLAARMQTPGGVSDGRLAILPQFQQDYEPVTASESVLHIRLDTAHPVEQCVQDALAGIQEGRSAYDCPHTYPGSD